MRGFAETTVKNNTVVLLVDLRPGAIINRFELRRPIYKNTAVYGHFGREDLKLPWENTDLAGQLKKIFVEDWKLIKTGGI